MGWQIRADHEGFLSLSNEDVAGEIHVFKGKYWGNEGCFRAYPDRGHHANFKCFEDAEAYLEEKAKVTYQWTEDGITYTAGKMTACVPSTAKVVRS